ncbi:MAG: hypothetical protein U9R28_03880 [Pseudomonadota bacterium]|nr:hypothetical protein [Pseudomonadota bacterium]
MGWREREAKGTNINCPFPAGAGDQTYLDVYDQVIAHQLEEFKPQQIIVFAGYDAHWQDHLAQHRVTVDGFNRLLQKIKNSADSLCGGRLALSLGGGISVRAFGFIGSGEL